MRRTPISHYTSAEWQAREVATLCKTYPQFWACPGSLPSLEAILPSRLPSSILRRQYCWWAMEDKLIGQNQPALAHFHQALERAMAVE